MIRRRLMAGPYLIRLDLKESAWIIDIYLPIPTIRRLYWHDKSTLEKKDTVLAKCRLSRSYRLSA